ncbi:DUF5047 domain-containing protein [Micromonospora mirobrigensis]|uniref:DUF5047 domain-containing protein n=1 Tax=Micromonospora mirobrigensis TaxID=262898 RepID=A0A1C4XDR3_9ACTN|nr:DUF5047 domain-containing protein [Micromonospora mirobrigensis]SCF06653.1 protein of unknown function (DUF5047) [Micromonospora mirobrigensis]
MIPLSTVAQSVLTRSFKYKLRVESWLGPDLLADDVPVSSASEEADRSLRVPERVTLTIPRLSGGTSWSPVTDNHPLAANGQRLRVQLGIGVGGGQMEWIQRGWFVIQESVAEGDTVNVSAVGLLSLVEEARLVSPFQPSGTLVSTLRGLVEPTVTVVVDNGLTDRAVPSGINYDDDRLGAVMELLDAWGADAYVTEDGYLLATPMGPSMTPVLSLTDGAGGTVIQASGASTRENAYNVVVARGTTADGGQVQGVAYNYTGPKGYGGYFNPLPVPYFYESPLLTTVAQCNLAARTVLSRLNRSTAKEFRVEMVPHPALQAGDTVQITTDDYPNLLCVVEALTLPYKADGGVQTLKLRSLA